MNEDRRKIATILAADVAGYSRLMEQDEEATLAALKTTRRIFDQSVEQFGGREFGSVGDSLMAQFPSVVNAVRCARAIQDKLTAENENLPAGRRMDLRMGINLGDVIEEGDTLYGDGVNMAARIQEYAAPGRILITGAVHEQIENKIEMILQHCGRRYVKNINHPIELYEVLPDSEKRRFIRISALTRLFTNHPVTGIAVIILVTIALVLITESKFNGNKATSDTHQNQIAVLPFVNLSNDASNDWLGQGLSEDILNLLAQIKELKVVARTSSFQPRLQSMNVTEIGRQLNAHYVLDGSIRRSGEHTLVNARLDDADTGYNLWSHEFERSTKDTFNIQREIAEQVVKELKLNLPISFNMGQLKRPTKNVDAYDYYIQARSFLDRTETEKSLKNAEQFFRRALKFDPEFGLAYAGLCISLVHQIELQQSSNVLPAAGDACNQADKLTPDSYIVHVAKGELYKVQGESDNALREFKWAMDHSDDDIDARLGIADVYAQSGNDKAAVRAYQDAIQINPGYSRSYRLYGFYLLTKGRFDEATKIYQRLVVLEPTNMGAYNNLGYAYLSDGNFKSANNALRKVVSQDPNAFGYNNIGMSYYYLGRYTDAAAMYQAAIDMLPDNYRLWGNLGDALGQLPDKREEAKEAYQKALRLAEQQLKINENQGNILAYKAHYCAQLNDRECATSSVAKALQLADSDPDTHYNAAVTYLELNKPEQAEIQMKQAENHGYSHKLLYADSLLAPLHVNGQLTTAKPERVNQGGNN